MPLALEAANEGAGQQDVPTGRAIAGLQAETCLSALEARAVPFQRVDSESAPGIEMPVRLQGPVGGVVIEARGGHPWDGVLDCRLALALLAWAPTLRAGGVRALEAWSILRPGARVRRTGAPSGHASGLALDVGSFELEGGTRLDVAGTWAGAERGHPPCPADARDSADLARLRGAVCSAVEQGIFQIVLTPHFDLDHRDHVHVEVRPQVDWSFVR